MRKLLPRLDAAITHKCPGLNVEFGSIYTLKNILSCLTIWEIVLIRYPLPTGSPHLDDLEVIGLVQSVGLYFTLFSVIAVVGYLTYMLYKVKYDIIFTDLNCYWNIMKFCLYSQVYSADIRDTMLFSFCFKFL